MAAVIFEQHMRIPLGLKTFEEFRQWSHSNDFPQVGRIDFVGGDIEVDMSPEDLFAHGTLKGKIYATLLAIIESRDLGHVFTDSTRVSHAKAGLSAEPDILFVSHDGLDDGRSRLVPKSTGEPDRFIEIEGSPDLIVEIVSDSSYQKDSQRLRNAYFAAGVAEYWILDARSDPLFFEINLRDNDRFAPARIDEEGFQRSSVLRTRFRIDRDRSSRGYWRYHIHESAPES